MANYQRKSKWNSQKIQKQFKNKRHDDIDDWSTWSNSNHSKEFTTFCNEYQKNIATNEHQHEYEYKPKYWRCNVCTFDNKECDLQCEICQSPFKSKSKSIHYTSDNITLGDYIPSHLNNIINIEDDMDESVQIAIILSYKSTSKNNDINQQSIYYDDDDHINIFYHKTQKIKNKKELIRERKQKQEERRKIEERRAKKREQKRKRKEIERKQKEEKRKKEEEEKRLKQLTDILDNNCPKLKTFVTKDNDIFSIKKSIESSYNTVNKKVDIKLILNSKILKKFVSNLNCMNKYKIVYHGTNEKNNTSIIEKGLIIGGTRGIPRAHGACHGVGVYCSPHTDTARGYESGSMFICVVKNSNKLIHKNGNIWVIKQEKDILPLYLASFKDKVIITPRTPIITPPLPPAPRPVTVSNPVPTVCDGLSQKVIRFIPGFGSLNRAKPKRKIQRKWSAYHKINVYAL